jgi:hypothetical protein
MSDSDFTAAYERVLTALGIWHAEETCTTPTKPVDDDEFGDVWCPTCGQVFGCGSHDIPPPELTDALAWQVLIAYIRQNKRGVEFKFPYQHDPDPKRALILALDAAL